MYTDMHTLIQTDIHTNANMKMHTHRHTHAYTVTHTNAEAEIRPMWLMVPLATRGWKKPGTDSLLELVQPCQYLDFQLSDIVLDFWPTELRENKLLLL